MPYTGFSITCPKNKVELFVRPFLSRKPDEPTLLFFSRLFSGNLQDGILNDLSFGQREGSGVSIFNFHCTWLFFHPFLPDLPCVVYFSSAPDKDSRVLSELTRPPPSPPAPALREGREWVLQSMSPAAATSSRSKALPGEQGCRSKPSTSSPKWSRSSFKGKINHISFSLIFA